MPSADLAAARRGIAAARPSFVLVALAFLRRGLAESASYRAALVLKAASMAFFLATFFYLARFINAAAADRLGAYGGDYFRFVLLGLILTNLQWAAVGAFAARLREAQLQGTLEAMFTTPASPAAIVLAAPLYDLAAALVRAAIYVAVGGALLGFSLGPASALALALGALAAMAAFAGLGLLAGAAVLIFRRSEPISPILGGLSTLLGGVLYPVSVLPGWMAGLGDALPITHALEVIRRSLLAGAGVGAVAGSLLVLAAMAAGFFLAGLLLFRTALRRALRDGSLAHY